MMEQRTDTSNYCITHLERKHIKNKFHCGIEVLDDYIKTQASQDIKKNVAVTYVMTALDSEQVIGYYTLSSIGVIAKELPDDIIKKLPRYPVLPGILIGRLARDKAFYGKEIGQYLLIDALKRSVEISVQLGMVAVIVDAKNDKAVTFYESFGFLRFPDNQRRLFISVGTIKKLEL